MPGFVEHQGARFAREHREAFAARRCLGRQEAFEHETVAGEASDRQGGDECTRARHRADPDSRGARGAHEAETGVAHQRRARIGDQRQRFAGEQACDQLRGDFAFVVFVHRQQWPLDAEMREQAPAVPRVLGADRIDRAQHLQRPRREIAEVADRGGDDVQRAWAWHGSLGIVGALES